MRRLVCSDLLLACVHASLRNLFACFSADASDAASCTRPLAARPEGLKEPLQVSSTSPASSHPIKLHFMYCHKTSSSHWLVWPTPYEQSQSLYPTWYGVTVQCPCTNKAPYIACVIEVIFCAWAAWPWCAHIEKGLNEQMGIRLTYPECGSFRYEFDGRQRCGHQCCINRAAVICL